MITSAEITCLYLYGTSSRPPLVDNILIRPANVLVETSTNVDEYMNAGPGRFANPTFFKLVQDFFDSAPGFRLQAGSYTEQTLRALWGTHEAYIEQHQWEYGDSINDYGERTYIWNSVAYEIDDRAQFIVDADGRHHIENFAIIPYSNSGKENFDFVSDDLPAQIANYLTTYHGKIDPSNLGRTVEISFDGERQLSSYDASDFHLDSIKPTHYNPTLLLSLEGSVGEIVNNLWQSGIIEFVDAQDRAIFYGTDGNDSLVADTTLFSKAPLLASYAENGVVLVGGAGNDVLTGTASGDHLLGGKDNDVLLGDSGNDELVGGEGNDSLVGGDGADTLRGGDGDDTLVLGNLNGVNGEATSDPEIIDGGAGNDNFVVTGPVGSTVTLGKGEAGDHLFVHASLLGIADTDPGSFGLFNLSGGVYEATPWSIDGLFFENFNADSNLQTDDSGLQYRSFSYTQQPYGTYASESPQFYVNYRFYESESRLSIEISSGSDPETAETHVLQTIEVSSFSNGDYGIALQGVFLPYGTFAAGDYVDPVKWESGLDPTVVAAYDAAVHAMSAAAFDVALAADGTLHAANPVIPFFSTDDNDSFVFDGLFSEASAMGSHGEMLPPVLPDPALAVSLAVVDDHSFDFSGFAPIQPHADEFVFV